MIDLAEIIEQYQESFFLKYKGSITSQQRWALNCIVNCQKSNHLEMVLKCDGCGAYEIKPHSCGNRNCPKCQNHETSIWLDRQRSKLLPVDYYMITFTLPAQLRSLCYTHQKEIYDLMFFFVAQTLKEFALNPENIGGEIGFTSVLHTSTRKLGYHPHIHVLIPGGAIDKVKGLWKKKKTKYLFSPDNLSKVFGAKFRQAVYEKGYTFPGLPKKWVVDVVNVGHGEAALKYLSKYMYRGPISEKQIVSNHNGEVTFAYIESESKKRETRTLPGEDFLMLILQHVLPKGFRRSRDYGFLHPNAKKTLLRLQLFFHVKVTRQEERKRSTFCCKKCGGNMKVVRYGIKSNLKYNAAAKKRAGPQQCE